ncbi:hypothetical protein IE81DRAFT_178225 [Ceraceosorus guamensis]|uniref:SH3 domain-containing protein n=1 Tax=Ceraceosorus guamensis TaxID=1522189 RepID=A0A316W106_9BASI|nr:hypothetical protein IE81DRAFT_178225 [Ceraceosorus guamensis]PWN41355.1 hypothetical protein IE81DRAFT_178225 [Ceraceosorus guamensis]
MAQVKPNLTVDVGLAQTGGRAPAQAAKAAIHAARSASAPRSENGDGSLPGGGGYEGAYGGTESAIDMNAQSIENGRTAAADGFSSDEDGDGQDLYAAAQRRLQHGATSKGARATRDNQHGGASAQGGRRMYADNSDSDHEDYGPQGETEVGMDGNSDDDGVYDEEEEDDLSSSPSIPDENIDFDLVYALHNFVATVEGQATVHKGNDLTLLDDSNSYWWLVRVLRTSEVGYIPAENIETPFERLARLNKHRNVDLTSATDDDHNQVPDKIYNSHLVKQRSFGVNGGISAHSGKLSALSRRNAGGPPAHILKEQKRIGKRGVLFGPSTYLEHSGNEMSSDEEGDYDEEAEEGEMDGEDYDEEGTEAQGDGSGAQGASGVTDVRSRGEPVDAGLAGVGAARGPVQGSGASGSAFDRLEPDDGMDWDAGEAERVQQAQQARNRQEQAQAQATAQQQQQQTATQQQQRASAEQARQASERSSGGSQISPRQQAQLGQTGLQTSPSQQQRGPVGSPGSPPYSPEQAQLQGQQQYTLGAGIPGSLRPGEAPGQHARNVSSSERSISSLSSAGGQPATPSQIQAERARASTELAGQAGRVSPAAPSSMKADRDSRRMSNRKSRGEEDAYVPEEKTTKKRSGVFSGLFSRSKDKKDRKSATFSDDAATGRSSEDSFAGSAGNRRSGAMSPGMSPGLAGPPQNYGRTMQDRDRVVQEAYQRQFLTDSNKSANQSAADAAAMAALGNEYSPGPHPQSFQPGKTRPGSLIGTPSYVPMLNVMRVFAGDAIGSEATFKTVLLNEATSAEDLVKQAMQRFRVAVDSNPDDYYLTVKLLEGEERALGALEKPLQVYDKLSESSPDQISAAIPSVKRSSVGSISSISSNLSLKPAITRLGEDFGDDHAVKFFLHRRAPLSARGAGTSDQGSSTDTAYGGQGLFPTNDPKQSGSSGIGIPLGPGSQRNSATSTLTPESAEAIAAATARFALRLIIFPSDLPEGTVFDPQTNALIPEAVLRERGPGGLVPGEGVEQRYREKVLALPRNTTVAEVIEQGLDRFGVMEGLVEGGDDVEDRTSRRRSKGRVRYGLSADIRGDERPLGPASKVLDAYLKQPVFRDAPGNRRSADGKRRSFDAATLLAMVSDLRADDPVFILRQVQQPLKAKGARPLSPTENVLLDKINERRQAELETVQATPLTRTAEDPAAPFNPSPPVANQSGMSRQEIIAAQRAAAHERRAAVLGAQRNAQQGVDVVLADEARIRSSRAGENGKVRYSYVPNSGAEQDISNIIEDVLKEQDKAMAAAGLSSSPARDASRPAVLRNASRGTMATSEAEYESASSSPRATSPLSLREVNFDLRPSNSRMTTNDSDTLTTPPLSLGKKSTLQSQQSQAPAGAQGGSAQNDLLESFVRNPDASEANIEERIDQVLSRVTGLGASSGSGLDPSRLRDPASPASKSSSATPRGPSPSYQNVKPKGGVVGGLAGLAAAGGSLAAGAAALTAGALNAVSGGDNGGSLANTAKATSRSTNIFTGSSADLGLQHLFAVVDAAARRDPRSGSRIPPVDATSLRPQVAGLFAPNAPPIESRKTREAYAPVGKQLNMIEDALDQLLMDALRVL